jgi:MraZ protein
MITTGLDPFLVAYPLQEWEAFLERLGKLPQFDDDVTLLRRIYVSGAIDCEFDKLGRILIPAPLREHASLTREVVWAGMGQNLELWSKKLFDDMRSAVLGDETKKRAMTRRLAELGL